jgi:hypothetical protein
LHRAVPVLLRIYGSKPATLGINAFSLRNLVVMNFRVHDGLHQGAMALPFILVGLGNLFLSTAAGSAAR